MRGRFIMSKIGSKGVEVLSDRRQRVLAALIEEYVARALPVGSRTLTERYRLGVSPATVRNELSVLEDEGYISQPHTSAGRIPTDFGYRAFVDDLIESGSVEEDDDSKKAVEELRSSAKELDDLMDQASLALTRLTDCLSIVLAPSICKRIVKQVTLISLDDYSAIIVIVTSEGEVLNKRVEFLNPVSGDDLARAQRTINDLFGGHEATDFDKEASTLSDKGILDPLSSFILEEVISSLKESNVGHAHRLGVSSLMRKPEFKQTESLLPIIQVLEDDAILMQLLDISSERSNIPIVKIGKENESELLSGVSVVASSYGRGDGEGVVAVIGPTRMDYSKVLKAVRMASSALDD